MSLRLFEGPAGSGKTTCLFDAAREHVEKRPLDADQHVLALTKMHGSRRRMHGKLAEVLGTGRTSDCATLNSFALRLVHRWRSLARTLVPSLPADDDHGEVARLAARLLQRDGVANWVAARYPLLLVDELQDLRGSDLAVVRGLHRRLDVLCAADEFQELDPQGPCEGVEWARREGDVTSLVQIHRTSVAGLLKAARSLRSGAPLGTGVAGSKLEGTGAGFWVFATPNARVAASFLARNLTWWAAPGRQTMVLSPAGPDRSPWVRESLERLAAGPFTKNNQSFGPFRVPWETSATEEVSRCKQLLNLDGGRQVSLAEITDRAAELPGPLVDWARTRHRLAGQNMFSADSVREQLGRAHALQTAHDPPRYFIRRGLTVHQAKNREFDGVIVLWPVVLGGGAEVQRRLLYNAITRAKRDCLVLVQDPKPADSRLHWGPFRAGQ